MNDLKCFNDIAKCLIDFRYCSYTIHNVMYDVNMKNALLILSVRERLDQSKLIDTNFDSVSQCDISSKL